MFFRVAGFKRFYGVFLGLYSFLRIFRQAGRRGYLRFVLGFS